MVYQMLSLEYHEPKVPIFTEADQRLLDTPALAFYDPEYVDRENQSYKSDFQKQYELAEFHEPTAWERWTAFNNIFNNTSQ